MVSMTTETTNAHDETAVWPCVVCGEPATPEARSDCYRCGEYFHLRLTTTAEGPDCGDVWIDDEVMALQFACRTCLNQQLGEPEQSAQEPSTSESAVSEPNVSESAVPRPKAHRATPGARARDLARRRR